MNYAVCDRTPGSEGSRIGRYKTFGRAVSRARKHNAEAKIAVGVWSDVSESYLLEIAVDGTESKPAPTCPNSIRQRGLEAMRSWDDRFGMSRAELITEAAKHGIAPEAIGYWKLADGRTSVFARNGGVFRRDQLAYLIRANEAAKSRPLAKEDFKKAKLGDRVRL